MIDLEPMPVYDRVCRLRIVDLLLDPTVKREMTALLGGIEDDAWEEWWREQDRKLELANGRRDW